MDVAQPVKPLAAHVHIDERAFGENVSVLKIERNGEEILFEGNRLNFTESGVYTVTAEAEGKTYSFVLELDSTAPTLELIGVKDGGVSVEYLYAFVGRKQKKRDMRALWITRINAAARLNGTTYSKLMNGLKKANIDVNRKVLADMAVNDAQGFASLVELAKSKLA